MRGPTYNILYCIFIILAGEGGSSEASRERASQWERGFEGDGW